MSFFVEVGSCDFDTCERLIKNDWDGIVIEPVKYYYDNYLNIRILNMKILQLAMKKEKRLFII